MSRLFEVRRLHARKKRDGSSSRLSKSHGPAWGFRTPGLHATGMKQRSGNDGVQMRREEGKRAGEKGKGTKGEREETDRSSLTAVGNKNEHTRVNSAGEVRVLREEGKGTAKESPEKRRWWRTES